jgi:pimeloyl-ACP methyl ester carboxylesterase
VLYSGLLACHTYAGGDAAAAKVTCPVLLMLARRDQMTPMRAGVEFAKHLPQAKIVQLSASGHSVMTEEPDAVLDALAAFLA